MWFAKPRKPDTIDVPVYTQAATDQCCPIGDIALLDSVLGFLARGNSGELLLGPARPSATSAAVNGAEGLTASSAAAAVAVSAAGRDPAFSAPGPDGTDVASWVATPASRPLACAPDAGWAAVVGPVVPYATAGGRGKVTHSMRLLGATSLTRCTSGGAPRGDPSATSTRRCTPDAPRAQRLADARNHNVHEQKYWL